MRPIAKPRPTTALLAALAALAAAGPAAADDVRLGLLDCNPAETSGLLFGSGDALECSFTTGNRPPVTYAGLIVKTGTDPVATPGASLSWEVEGPADAAPETILEGSYAREAAPAGGATEKPSNRLVGGNGGAVRLRPASVMSTASVNLAGNIAALKLKAK
jgi:hypothetical protein